MNSISAGSVSLSCRSLYAASVSEIDVARREALLDERRAGGKRERRLRDVVRRIRLDAQAKRFDLAFLRRRADQHAVAARALHLLHHQLGKLLEHELQILRPLALPGGHDVQQRPLAEVEADHI